MDPIDKVKILNSLENSNADRLQKVVNREAIASKQMLSSVYVGQSEDGRSLVKPVGGAVTPLRTIGNVQASMGAPVRAAAGGADAGTNILRQESRRSTRSQAGKIKILASWVQSGTQRFYVGGHVDAPIFVAEFPVAQNPSGYITNTGKGRTDFIVGIQVPAGSAGGWRYITYTGAGETWEHQSIWDYEWCGNGFWLTRIQPGEIGNETYAGGPCAFPPTIEIATLLNPGAPYVGQQGSGLRTHQGFPNPLFSGNNFFSQSWDTQITGQNSLGIPDFRQVFNSSYRRDIATQTFYRYFYKNQDQSFQGDFALTASYDVNSNQHREFFDSLNQLPDSFTERSQDGISTESGSIPLGPSLGTFSFTKNWISTFNERTNTGIISSTGHAYFPTFQNTTLNLAFVATANLRFIWRTLNYNAGAFQYMGSTPIQVFGTDNHCLYSLAVANNLEGLFYWADRSVYYAFTQNSPSRQIYWRFPGGEMPITPVPLSQQQSVTLWDRSWQAENSELLDRRIFLPSTNSKTTVIDQEVAILVETQKFSGNWLRTEETISLKKFSPPNGVTSKRTWGVSYY